MVIYIFSHSAAFNANLNGDIYIFFLTLPFLRPPHAAKYFYFFSFRRIYATLRGKIFFFFTPPFLRSLTCRTYIVSPFTEISSLYEDLLTIYYGVIFPPPRRIYFFYEDLFFFHGDSLLLWGFLLL